MSETDRTEEYAASETRGGARFRRSLLAFLLVPMLALGTAVGAGILGLGRFEYTYEDRIFPGVVVWGTDLSGLTRYAARSALQANLSYPDEVAFSFIDPGTGKQWSATPSQLGMTFDAEATAVNAFEVGRSDSVWEGLLARIDAFRNSRQLSPVVHLDWGKTISFLEELAEEIAQPTVDASVMVTGVGLETAAEQIGRQMSVEDAFEKVSVLLVSYGEGEIELVIEETGPAVTDSAVAEVVATAQQLTGRPITLFVPGRTLESDPEPRVLGREELEGMLVLELDSDVSPARYTVRLDEEEVIAWLAPLAELLEVPAVDARFVFNDDTRELDLIGESASGRWLDVPATLERIRDQATSDDREVPLAIKIREPLVSDDATAIELGITELVSVGRTYFRGSSSARVHNVATAASRFHGVVVRPRTVFSFNHYLGEVTREGGYEDAPVISVGRTTQDVGGGVCQVSTTSFQAVFYGGFQILQRSPHGYRVAYYEYGEGPGMDATVFFPHTDFQFFNDTPYHLLLETYVSETASSLTFKIYSTSDGRSVEKLETEVLNEVPHPPDRYEENPDLEEGQIKQIDVSADGADVWVRRIVRSADGEILHEDVFYSHYLPWQAVYEYGPGTELPTPEPTETPEGETAAEADATPTATTAP